MDPNSEFTRTRPLWRCRGRVARWDQLLVIRRSALVLAPRAICFPGGGIEPGESEPQALIRELQEELAVDVLPVRCLWRSVTAWRIALAWWLASLPADASAVPNPAEVESVHWLTPDEIREHPDLLQGNCGFLDAVCSGQIELR